MHKNIDKNIVLIISIIILSLVAGCAVLQSNNTDTVLTDRLSEIPDDIVKILPEDDMFPPVLHSDLWIEPIPMPYPINSAGGEDSPFITPDGKNFYFFFTPDVRKEPGYQITDGTTGIYWSKRNGEIWETPQRVVLQDKNELSLDGCVFVQDDLMWFCSARDGNSRDIDFYIAHLKDGRWTEWENTGMLLNVDYEIGELHIVSDSSKMYFHSEKDGGLGGLDIWMSQKTDGLWQQPENVTEVNSPDMEGWPFISGDGKQLWITKSYKGSPAIFRSIKDTEDRWSKPELIISRFAGEPTLDSKGNIYFVHHFYKDSVMLEVDIYAAYKK